MKCPICGETVKNPIDHAKKHIKGKKGGSTSGKKSLYKKTTFVRKNGAKGGLSPQDTDI